MWRWIVDNFLWSSIYFYHYLLLDLYTVLTDEFVKHVPGSVIKGMLWITPNAFNVFTDMGALILIPLNRKQGWWLKSGKKNWYVSIKYFVLVLSFYPKSPQKPDIQLYSPSLPRVFWYLGRLSVHCLTQLPICQMRIIHIYLLWRSLFKLCERSLTWTNVSVKLCLMTKILKILNDTFPLVSTAVFAAVSFWLAAVHWR